ncbi:RNA-directed RNA polymerase [ssRNA phage SRR5466365_1]|uniref:RNA-directed RNA polymerase n=1 Tax=ssRNA phage SRR5466365_1 TaxID=2786400 RepID=A0A8S5L037_9VIRU|nr:RNA-directed RNA polymerase [ssRNA phage SRR5466365_1]DAD50807.1 TPA_asm: RNA-directed RNA polymerase [ssRNA phage SRR5466365_1]
MGKLPSVSESLSRDIKASGISLPCKHSDPWATARESAARSVVDSLFKKFKDLECTALQDDAAFRKFNACNLACADWTLQLNTSLDEELYGNLRDILYRFFLSETGDPIADNLDDCFMHGSLGSGASLGSPHESLYAKLFSSKLSAPTRGLIYHYENYIWQFPEWSNAELLRKASHGDAKCRDSSRLSFVAKNDLISRPTCTETPLGMFYQLGLGHIIECRLASYFGIRLSTQPDINRERARIGSIDGSWATIDLESASDTIGFNMCKGILPQHVLGLIELIRSKNTEYKGTVIPLNMVSTMGNGFTFPLQTAIFAAVVKSAGKTLGIDMKKVDVFGDDIAVPTALYERVCRLLHLLGFKVNPDKSFHKGPFRESCGHDYHSGVNVRGVYIKSLRDDRAINVAINRLNAFSILHGIPLPRTIKTLKSYLERVLFVPMDADEASGIKVLVSVHDKRPAYSLKKYAYKYTQWEWKPHRFVWKRFGMPVPKGVLTYNCSGLLLSLLYGEVVPSFVTSRDVGRWRTKLRYSSSWDYIPPTSPLAGVRIGEIRSYLECNLN